MRAALQEALYERYPLIFRQRNFATSESAMGRGIECADGWYPLLDGLCDVLSHHARDGAHPLVEAVQVKQKFGGLRFDFEGGGDRSKGAVRLASAMSYRVCEETGRPGMLMVRNRWVRTLAEDVGRMHGFRPRGQNPPEPGEQDITAAVASMPRGWRAIAAVLKDIVSEEAPFAALRLGHRDTSLSVAIQNGTEWTEGAGECAHALSVRTNALTGAMRVPTGSDAYGRRYPA